MSRRLPALLLILAYAMVGLYGPGVVMGQTTRSGFKPTPGSTAVWTLPLNDAAGCFQSDGLGVVTLSACAGGGSGDITAVGSCTTGACFTSGAPAADLTLNNATSGTITLQAVTGALGTRMISFPAETGTVCTTGSVCSGYQSTVANVVDGTGAASKVAYWSDSNTLTSTTLFHFDGTRLGIGTAAPAAPALIALVSSPAGSFGNYVTTHYGTEVATNVFAGLKARGTSASPTQVLSGDELVEFTGQGYHSSSAFTTYASARIAMFAAENFTATAQSADIAFLVTPLTTAATENGTEAMRLTGESVLYINRYADSTSGAVLQGRKARGTAASPTQALSNDTLLAVGGVGYHSGAAFATSINAGMFILAAENFTSSAQGTNLILATTPTGSTTRANRMTVSAAGQVSIEALKTTGAASGKTVVCVDVVTGQLYASTSGVSCAN